MKVSQTLKAEHQKVLLMLQILERIGKNLEAGKEIDRKHLEQLAELIRTFIEKSHHAKEETILFPVIGNINSTGKVIVKDLLQEHFILHDLVRNISEGMKIYSPEDPKATLRLINSMEKYITLLRSHAIKEDEQLCDFMDKHLSKQEQEKLIQAFVIIETKFVGLDRYKELEYSFDNLKSLYL